VQLALVLYTAYNIPATLVSTPAGHAADRAGNLRACSQAALPCSVSLFWAWRA